MAKKHQKQKEEPMDPAAQDVDMVVEESSGAEEGRPPASYAATAARPGTGAQGPRQQPPGPPTGSPSPTPGTSTTTPGTVPAPRGATRKRKRALQRDLVDTESDEDTVEDGAMKAADLERINKMQAIELANAMGSRPGNSGGSWESHSK